MAGGGLCPSRGHVAGNITGDLPGGQGGEGAGRQGLVGDAEHAGHDGTQLRSVSFSLRVSQWTKEVQMLWARGHAATLWRGTSHAFMILWLRPAARCSCASSHGGGRRGGGLLAHGHTEGDHPHSGGLLVSLMALRLPGGLLASLGALRSLSSSSYMLVDTQY